MNTTSAGAAQVSARVRSQGEPIGQEAAISLIDAIDDPGVMRLVRTQHGVVIARSRAGDRPAGPFDLVFFVRRAIDFARRQRLIRTILNGDEPEGFPECSSG